jgi:hypothetical protein
LCFVVALTKRLDWPSDGRRQAGRGQYTVSRSRLIACYVGHIPLASGMLECDT